MIIPPPPNSIEETKLFDTIQKSDAKHSLLSLVETFIKITNPIVDSIIAGPFIKYTLHNRDHIKKVFHIAGYIISDHTLKKLNPAECTIFLYACYLHDMGMAVTEAEFRDYLTQTAFLESIEKWPEMKDAFSRTRELLKKDKGEKQELLELELADLQKAALANYLRPLHATKARYLSLIQQIKKAGRSDIFEINGQNFEPELIAICESHNLNATVLGEMLSAHEDRFGRAVAIGGFHVNTQFLSALLRLSDILDFDYERTPKILFESLGIKHSNLPGANVSLIEWQKHLSVHTIEILKDEIIISALSKHPIIESTIREFCQAIEHEIHDTVAILRRNTSEITDAYQIALPYVVRANIRSEGYVFMNLALKLDEASVMSLLMGNRLYSSSLVAIRELVQNAVDACLVRIALLGEYNYKPSVRISIIENKLDNSAWLVIKDNGIGMDEYVLKHHFFRVGSSYYSSTEYKRLYKNSSTPMPAITSKFGIGFLSTFMMGNEIEVATKKIYPGGGTSKGNKIFIERMGALAFVQEDDNIELGTVVKTKLNNSSTLLESDAIENFVKANVIRPMVSVEFVWDKKSFLIEPNKYYQLEISPKSEIHSNNIRVIELDINRSTGIEGKVFFLLFNIDNNQLSYKSNDQLIDVTTSSSNKNVKVNPNFIIPAFEGNKITVGGFKMSFYNLGKLFRHNKNRIAFIYDLDFSPTEEVNFDVSRTKILDERLSLRSMLRKAILTELKDKNIFQTLDAQTQSLLDQSDEKDAFQIDIAGLEKRMLKAQDDRNKYVTPELLATIEKELLNTKWEKNIHRKIADKLQISRNIAYLTISELLIQRKVTKPEVLPT